MQLTSIRLLVNDFDNCFKFYSEIMKFKVTWGKLGEVYASFDTGSTTELAIFPKQLMFESLGKTIPSESEQSQQVICFETSNVDADYTNLLELGVDFIDKPTVMPGWGIKCVHFSDPEGNIIELNQTLPKEEWDADLKKMDPSNE